MDETLDFERAAWVARRTGKGGPDEASYLAGRGGGAVRHRPVDSATLARRAGGDVMPSAEGISRHLVAEHEMPAQLLDDLQRFARENTNATPMQVVALLHGGFHRAGDMSPVVPVCIRCGDLATVNIGDRFLCSVHAVDLIADEGRE